MPTPTLKAAGGVGEGAPGRSCPHPHRTGGTGATGGTAAASATARAKISANTSSAAEIQAIPTLMAFKKGQLVFRHSGMLAANQLDEVISQIKEFDIDAAMADDSATTDI